MLTVTKIYRDIPFAHRQHAHEGHCAKVHGHNWEFKFEFRAHTLDKNGFVVDFGKLKHLKSYINDTFDHKIVLERTDPLLNLFLESPDVFDVITLESSSCEGIASELFRCANALLQDDPDTAGRTWVQAVTVREDSKNAATYIEGENKLHV